jgi:translocation and assembly module TamA
VSIDGVPGTVDRARLRRWLEGRLTEAERYDHQAYLDTKRRLAGWLGRRGYAWADVSGTVDVNRDTREANIALEARSGPLVHFGETAVTGHLRVPESAVRNRVAWEPGELYDQQKLEATRGQLYRLGFFRSVRVELVPPGGEVPAGGEVRADLRIDVAPVQRNEVRLGAGFALDNAHYEARLRAGYTRHHFLDPLARLRIDVKPAYSIVRSDEGNRGFGGEGVIALSRDDLFVPLLLGEARLRYQQRELESYSSRGPTVRLGLGRPFLDGSLSIGVGWELSRLSFPRVSEAIDPALREDLGLTGGVMVGFFDQSIALDRRDDILDPQHGYFAELRLEEGGVHAGGDFDYVRATADLRGYVPVVRRLVLAGRVRAGTRLTGELPIVNRYFAGGASSHRGFGHRQLSPFVEGAETRAAIGGAASGLASAEIRYNLMKVYTRWLGVVLFTDAGDVVGSLGDLDGAVHWAAGPGLRYDTPVGPLRVDLGIRLNRLGPDQPEPGERFAFHLSLGEAF